MKIEWTEPAVSDLEMVRDYIAKDSEFYALRFVERVFEVLEKVSVFPNSGRIVPEAEDSSIRERFSFILIESCTESKMKRYLC